jgi:parvulin-like peptidyl-prolyl isomerase
VFRDDAETQDMFVERRGSVSVLDKEFKFGRLGVLLPTYEREPLYLAYRALMLGRPALEKQEADTAPKTYEMDRPGGGVAVWLEQRSTVADQPPPRMPDQYRSFEAGGFGKYLNCANGAFNLATETLQALKVNAKLGKAAVQEWVAAQDAVFDLCGDPGNSLATPQPPAELSASAAPYLRQMRQYQVAAANFYAGDYADALRRFDAIAADKRHPMRAWANHAGLRTLLRSASMDRSFLLRVQEIRGSDAPMERKRADFAGALSENERKMGQIYEQIVARVKTIQADKTLETVHEPARKLLKQAAQVIVPDRVYTELSAILGRFDTDVERSRQLGEWGVFGDRLFDYGGHGDLIAKLRAQYEYFDWIRTIQGCTDNKLPPNFAGRCQQESAHALERWQASKSKTWLTATLITAQQLSPQLEPALEAARQSAPDSMEYLTLRYHMVKLLRGAGRRDEAAAMIDQVLAGPNYTVRPDGRRSMASANNLFRQERLALAKNEQQALPYLLRDSSRRLGADGDELLNRRLSSEDLLRLGKIPAVDAGLRSQLLVAAWWRGDMTGNTAAAEAAARQVIDAEPRLVDAALAYLKSTDADERHYLLAKAGMDYRISPQVFRFATDFAGRRKPDAADWWCSFNSDDFKVRAQIQRTPSDGPELAANAAARDAELVKLNQLGSAADWLARVALKRASTNVNDPSLRPMLESVVKSEKLDCVGGDDGTLLNSAKQILASLPGSSAVITEAAARARYELIKRAVAGKQTYHVSHILVKTEADAVAALAKIQAGARFDEIAGQVSIDRVSANKGGDLGWSLPDAWVKPFGDAVRSLPVAGLYPAPVQTPFGWHLIQVQGIRPFLMPSFEQAQPAIEQQLRKEQEK